MKIAINMTPLIKGKGVTGIGNYIIQIVSRILEEDETNEFYLISNGDLSVDFPRKENVHSVKINSSSSYCVSRYLIIKELMKEKVDVYWSPTQALPLIKPKRTKYFMTMYDVANLKNVGFARYNSLRQKLFRYVTKRSLEKADCVFSISEATKRDIIQVFNMTDENKIKTIYLGGNDSRKQFESNDVLDRFKISNPYFLYVGTLQPRKNIKTIVDGYIKYREKGHKGLLVLAGGVGWGVDDVLQRIKESCYQNDIFIMGYISETDKQTLYRNATGVVFPSLYEGFGIPILEAFEYGLPVITAKNTSLPEVGGEAALYLEDELSAGELAQLLEKVMELSEEERQEISQKDKEQLLKFDWDKCASETYDLLIQEASI